MYDLLNIDFPQETKLDPKLLLLLVKRWLNNTEKHYSCTYHLTCTSGATSVYGISEPLQFLTPSMP